MTNIVAFSFGEDPIRTIVDDSGVPWFVLRDVLEAMGSTTKTTDAVAAIEQGLGKGFVGDEPLPTTGGPQPMRARKAPTNAA